MPTYYKPLRRSVKRGQRFGANPGWGPNPPGGHNGDDYLSQVGEPVFAAGDGVVVFAGQFDTTYADNFGWNLNFGGNMIVLNLDGAEGPYVEYGHLSDIRVKDGDRVRAAQVIALTGESDGGAGVITGPHLHVGCLPPNFNLNTNTYGRVNPDIYLTEYWDGLSPQGTTITPLTQPSEEDDMLNPDTLKQVVDAVLYEKIPKYNQRGEPIGETTLAETVAWQESNFYLGRQLTIDAIRETVLGVLTSPVPDVATGGTTNLATEISWLPANFKRADGGAVDVEALAATIATAVAGSLTAEKVASNG